MSNEIDVDTHRHLTRQLDLIPLKVLNRPVTIIGCGAIGSFLGLQLAKMGMTNLIFFDHDTVSIENMSNQFYPRSAIGQNKASALYDMVRLFVGDTEAEPMLYVPRKFGEQHTDADNAKGIVVVAVDSMEARRMVYESIKEMNFKVDYIIDPRMSAEFFAMYVINPHDAKDQATYEKTLYSDEQAVPERCTAKSTVYTASLGAGLVTKAIKNILLRQPYPRNTQWDIAACRPMNMWSNQ